MSRSVEFSAGLDEANARFNSEVPHAIAPTSVLQPYMHSPNGMAEADSQRMMIDGSVRPSANGSSSGTYEEAFPRQMGRDIADPGAF